MSISSFATHGQEALTAANCVPLKPRDATTTSSVPRRNVNYANDLCQARKWIPIWEQLLLQVCGNCSSASSFFISNQPRNSMTAGQVGFFTCFLPRRCVQLLEEEVNLDMQPGGGGDITNPGAAPMCSTTDPPSPASPTVTVCPVDKTQPVILMHEARACCPRCRCLPACWLPAMGNYL